MKQIVGPTNMKYHPSSVEHDPLDDDRYSKSWILAMEKATVCLRDRSKISERALDTTLAYLAHLEKFLMQIPKKKWGFPPNVDPPCFRSFPTGTSNDALKDHPSGETGYTNLIQPNSKLRNKPKKVIPNPSTNAFQVFWDPDEDEETVTESEDDGGDEIVLEYHASGMNVLRLFVRLSTFQSDAQARKATFMVTRYKEWDQAALCLQFALSHTRKALCLADAQISEWYESCHDAEWLHAAAIFDPSMRMQLERRAQRQQDLMDDANIVHVGIQSLLDTREAYLADARRNVQRLRLRLITESEQREVVKRHMGDEKWKNNPNAKSAISRRRVQLRIAAEAELEKLERALEMMQMNDMDMGDLKKTANALLCRLKTNKKTRYNRQRPTDMSKRVEGFPDASNFGWFFTGSANNFVEFFEKPADDGASVKLDFYFTTGSVKVYMHDPEKGKINLVAQKNVSVDFYTQVLLDPLSFKGKNPK